MAPLQTHNNIEDVNKSIEDLLANLTTEAGTRAPDQSKEEIDALLNTPEMQQRLNDFDASLISKSDSSTEQKAVDTKSTSKVQKHASNNHMLLVSEKEKTVYLPYSTNEVMAYIEQYPEQYASFDDVVEKEFILPIDLYVKHPVISRFRETYALIRDRESKSMIEAFKLAMEVMFHYDLNPAIIAACKTQEQLEDYMDCLERKKLDDFKDFEIRFELMPFKNRHTKDAAF